MFSTGIQFTNQVIFVIILLIFKQIALSFKIFLFF